MNPGRSSRWPASHLRNRSSTNSKNVVFPTLSYQQDVTTMQRRCQVFAQLSLLRHSISSTDRQERGGCENGSSAPETRLWSLVRADEVMFWILWCCLTVSSMWDWALPLSTVTLLARQSCLLWQRDRQSCFTPVFYFCKSKGRIEALINYQKGKIDKCFFWHQYRKTYGLLFSYILGHIILISIQKPRSKSHGFSIRV